MGYQTRSADRVRRQDRRRLVRSGQSCFVWRRGQYSERRRSRQEVFLSTLEQLRWRIRRILARPQVSPTRFVKIFNISGLSEKVNLYFGFRNFNFSECTREILVLVHPLTLIFCTTRLFYAEHSIVLEKVENRSGSVI